MVELAEENLLLQDRIAVLEEMLKKNDPESSSLTFPEVPKFQPMPSPPEMTFPQLQENAEAGQQVYVETTSGQHVSVLMWMLAAVGLAFLVGSACNLLVKRKP